MYTPVQNINAFMSGFATYNEKNTGHVFIFTSTLRVLQHVEAEGSRSTSCPPIVAQIGTLQTTYMTSNLCVSSN